MAATNATLANMFQQMADVVEITGGNRFRALAFSRVARLLDELVDDVAAMSDEAIRKLPGVGAGAANLIREYLDTGRIVEHQRLMEQVPPGVLELLDVPGLGPKTIATLWKDAGVTSRADLQQKAATGELTALKGFGPKKLENLRKNLALAEEAGRRIRIGRALPLAMWFVDQLRGLRGVEQAAYAGSLRRGKETIGDLDLLVSAGADEAAAISEAFVRLPVVADVLGQGETKSSIRTQEGVQVDLRIVRPEQFGAALLYFTGSKEHNVALRGRAQDLGCTLNEYALADKNDKARVIASRTEEEIYAAMQLAWIAPELREGRDELERAAAGPMPALVERGDIRAELHAHTTASDGLWTIRELIEAAIERGFHTVAITDHSRSQFQAHGLDAARLEQHAAAVREAAEQYRDRIAVLAGTEVDILSDGRLDYPDSVLKQLDLVVASPHAALTQDPATATRRLLRAIDNSYVTILGHPTGRLVLRREGLNPDMKQVVKAAASRGIALEINANSYRLDLRDAHARLALDAGCRLAINTDAHGPSDLDQLIFGVLTARRAGAAAADVVNCLDAPALDAWRRSTRP